MNTLEALDELIGNARPGRAKFALDDRSTGATCGAIISLAQHGLSELQLRKSIGKIRDHALHAHRHERFDVAQLVDGPDVNIQPCVPRGR